MGRICRCSGAILRTTPTRRRPGARDEAKDFSRILGCVGGLQLVLAGAAIGTGNRGVDALARSVLDAVSLEAQGARLTVLDDGWGIRSDSTDRYQGIDVEFVGVRLSRRWHRPESWAQIRLAQVLGARLNPAAARIKAADAMLDLSAGDSFTDLYGPARLKSVARPKQAALRAGRPLILLPQTYGPFRTPEGRRLAEQIVRSTDLAYSRDPWSHQRLLELAGPDVDAKRLRRGVDVAFALEPRQPRSEVVETIAALPGTTAGVNVSGLLWTDEARERFSLAGGYLGTMIQLVRELINLGASVLLVSHVGVPSGDGESDITAIERLREGLTASEQGRVTVLPADLDASELKWCISQLDWFVGSRMHATIAALSTMTPALGYAYSDKTQGVFDTCGVSDQVIDARTCTGMEAVRLMLDSFLARNETRGRLCESAADTIDTSRTQLREVLEYVRLRTDDDTREPSG